MLLFFFPFSLLSFSCCIATEARALLDRRKNRILDDSYGSFFLPADLLSTVTKRDDHATRPRQLETIFSSLLSFPLLPFASLCFPLLCYFPLFTPTFSFFFFIFFPLLLLLMIIPARRYNSPLSSYYIFLLSTYFQYDTSLS